MGKKIILAFVVSMATIYLIGSLRNGSFSPNEWTDESRETISIVMGSALLFSALIYLGESYESEPSKKIEPSKESEWVVEQYKGESSKTEWKNGEFKTEKKG